ncbi:4'-phosphopantetheinyl transferase family protein [Paenarthrobacter nitroguajacolicus]|uniref:4'-phosphopantetheinyl transferase family protein n=1 Tax=Paenarthrobacter nitroguajacolicus TaxID=211146 RepID=UPI0015BF624C|nr:4'-phosphopantetheinyl transferase family protein [Paenarthrobacter nitroguajacolicus]NWL34711.1 phosphopantetheinyl transferase [Paenarthrobacter nitroguajacolicus]
MDSPLLELFRLDSAPGPGGPFEVLGAPALGRAFRLANPADRAEFVAGRLALMEFAAALLDVDPARLVPNYHCPQCGPRQDHGRPGLMLDGGPAPLVLSASRASGWVLLAGVVHPADGLRLGVDLEAVGQAAFEGFDDVALTAAEKEFLTSIPEQDQATQRARLWARKEAWLKMTGEGLRRNPAELDVLDRPGLRDITGPEIPDGLVAVLAIG